MNTKGESAQNEYMMWVQDDGYRTCNLICLLWDALQTQNCRHWLSRPCTEPTCCHLRFAALTSFWFCNQLTEAGLCRNGRPVRSWGRPPPESGLEGGCGGTFTLPSAHGQTGLMEVHACMRKGLRFLASSPPHRSLGFRRASAPFDSWTLSQSPPERTHPHPWL